MVQTLHQEAAAGHGQAEIGSVGRALAGKYMAFKLAAEIYGIEILKVREIIGLMDITRVPKAPEHIRGVINLRGKVIPVMDLRAKFGMPLAETTDQTVIIVVQLETRNGPLTMGVLVDEVLEVLRIATEQIEPRPDFGGGTAGTDFIMGIGKSDKRVIFLLDTAKVLSAEELSELTQLNDSNLTTMGVENV